MARPTKPKELKNLQGTLRPDRDITVKASTVSRSEFPEPILDLNDRAREYYDLTIDHLNEAEVLRKVDAVLLSILAKNLDLLVTSANEITSLDDVVQTFESGATNITGTFTAFERATKAVLTLSSKLGLSPSDREKLMAFAETKSKDADPYDALKMTRMG